MENSSDEEPDSGQDQPYLGEIPSDDEANDRRILYFIIGGILLAFAIGFTFLVVAMVIDWQ
jgi:hypothetical protein